MQLEIEHLADQNLFETLVEGHRCILVYRKHEDVLTVIHTGVPSVVGGRGIAAELTAFALEYVKTHTLKIVPECSYTAAYINKHPEFKTLLA